MKPGRELDILVAEKVMGFKIKRKTIDCEYLVEHSQGSARLPDYSTDIAAAWEVMEKLKLVGLEIGYDRYRNKWFCTNLAEDFRYAFDLSESDFKDLMNDDLIAILSDTAPHAICLAAIKIVGVKI